MRVSDSVSLSVYMSIFKRVFTFLSKNKKKKCEHFSYELFFVILCPLPIPIQGVSQSSLLGGKI